MKRFLLSVTCVVCLAASLRTGAAQYGVVDLGPGYATAINESSQVVGWSSSGSPASDHAWLWQDGTLTNLPNLPGYTQSHTTAINNHGQIVGNSTNSNHSEACLWENGGVTDLGNGPANAINDSGQIAGGPTLWNDGVPTGLGGCFAYGINNLSQVVGSVWRTVGDVNYPQACLWQNNTITRLDYLYRHSASYAQDINDWGTVVGYSSYFDAYAQRAVFHAVLWQHGDVADLGPGSARAINNFGQIAGHSDGHACIWQNGNVTVLPMPSGCTESGASGINDNGEVVGWSRDAGSSNFRATLWQPIPEPSTILALLCGVAGLGGMMWRRAR